MLLRQIGFGVLLAIFCFPTFAKQCPTADEVSACQNGGCIFRHLSGWTSNVFYTDTGKLLAFQKSFIQDTDRGRELNCYYSYFSPDTHRLMPPALLLKTITN